MAAFNSARITIIKVCFALQVFARDKDKIDQSDVCDLIQAAYQTAKVAHRTCCLPDDIINAVVKAVVSVIIFYS